MKLSSIKNLLMVVTSAFLLTAGAAVAQSDPAALLAELDADGSGSLSQEEAAGNDMLAEKFIELDIDGSGDISAEELAALIQ